MEVRLMIVAFLAVSAVYVSGKDVPKFPSKYHMKGSFNLPYFNLTETLEVWADTEGNKERIDFYNGLTSSLMRADKKMFYLVHFEDAKRRCMKGGPPNGEGLISFWPDIDPSAGWEYKGTTPLPGVGTLCDYWQQHVQEGPNKTAVYTYYQDATLGVPLRFKLFGYDSIFGSHHDMYLLDYFQVDDQVSDSDFDVPEVCKGSSGRTDVPFQKLYSSMRLIGSFTASADTFNQFSKFQKKHGKSYSHDEYMIRMANFHENKLFVDHVNKKKLSYKVALNHMSDLSYDEYLANLLPKRAAGNKESWQPATGKPKFRKLMTTRPSTVDWREKGAVTMVKDQAACGSCWSFGTTGALEGQLAIHRSQSVMLSEQQLVDCSWAFQNNGCEGGDPYKAYEYIKKAGGIQSEHEYPYIGQDGYCSFDKSKIVTSISGYRNITEGDIDGTLDALANIGPLAVAIDAAHKSFMFYASGVFFEPECKSASKDLDHSVLAVGYGTDKASGQDYWIVKNSWSTYWGDLGYVKMSRKDNNCGVASDAVYPLL